MGKTNNRRGSTEKTTIPGITVNIETVLPGLPGLQLRGKEEANIIGINGRANQHKTGIYIPHTNINVLTQNSHTTNKTKNNI